MKARVKKYAKFTVALLAAAGVVASSGALDGQAELWLNVGIGAVGAFLVAYVPNVELPERADRG